MTEPSADPRAERSMNRADLLSGLVFAVLGLAIVYLSWTMPRLEIRGIHPATVPGLVPGLLGLALAFCGAILGIKAYLEGRSTGGWGDFLALFKSVEAGRFLAVAGLALAYALVVVGLVPFWLASAAFVFAFVLVFETWLSPEPAPLLRTVIWAVVLGLAVGWTVTLVFQYGFLVRLP